MNILRKKSIILLSSGLDSSVNLAVAGKKTEILFALTFDYGQKAAKRELYYSEKLCGFFNVKHKIIKLDFYEELIKNKLIPKISAKDLENIKITQKAANQVWMHNRNGLFINIAASFAEKEEADLIITGFNAEEAKTFPDNSKEFVKKINESLKYSTLNKVQVKSYTQNLNKSRIYKLGQKLNLPFEFVWPCYKGGKTICGVCESCRRYKRAVAAAL